MTVISVADRWTIITWKREGLGPRRIQNKLKKLFNKDHSLTGIKSIIKKFESTGDVQNTTRCKPKSARTPRNIRCVKKELNKKTRSSPKRTPHRLAQKLNISRSSVARILKFDIGAKAYKSKVVHKLNDKNKEDRLQRCRWLLRNIREDEVENIIFTDESIFPMSGYHNSQNERIYAVSKKDITPDEFLKEKQQFPRSLMVWMGVSMKAKTPVIFCEEGAKMNAEAYRNLLVDAIPKIKRNHRGAWMLQQDSAPSHRAESTQKFLKENVPAFIPANKWPPCSPDLNPMDYCVWGLLKQKVYSRHFNPLMSSR